MAEVVAMEDFEDVEMEVFGAAEVVEIRVEEAVVRHGRSPSHPVERGRKWLSPLPHVCSSCEELRMSFRLRHPQVRFTFKASVCAFCSILVPRIVLLLSRVLLD